MISQTVLGIDPGVNGGLAVLNPFGTVIFVKGIKSRMSEKEVIDIIKEAVNEFKHYHDRACFMEKVQHMTGDGGKGSHTFGYIKGLIRGVLRTLDVHPRYVYPAIWQAKLDCMSGGNKNITKRRAKEIFPELPKITHAIADALLIAEYGRRLTCL